MYHVCKTKWLLKYFGTAHIAVHTALMGVIHNLHTYDVERPYYIHMHISKTQNFTCKWSPAIITLVLSSAKTNGAMASGSRV